MISLLSSRFLVMQLIIKAYKTNSHLCLLKTNVNTLESGVTVLPTVTENFALKMAIHLRASS